MEVPRERRLLRENLNTESHVDAASTFNAATNDVSLIMACAISGYFVDIQ